MPKYTIGSIAQIVSGELIGSFPQGLVIEQLLLDSRKIIFPGKSLFFAIKGKRHDGHAFLAQAYEKGLRCFVVSDTIPQQNFPEACFIKVEDSLVALQALCAYHRQQFQLQVIGITGSNGKTIVKEWLHQLLQDDFQIVRSPKSYNSQIGVPLSVWQIQAPHHLGIFEAGISERQEMERLAPIIDCHIGVFTNIGTAHAAGFSNQEEKIEEKLKLFSKTAILIYCKDHFLVHQAICQRAIQTRSWSRESDADLRVLTIRSVADQQTRIEACYQGKDLVIRIPFKDEASIENAIHCWLLLLHLGISQEKIQQRMLALETVGMRLELLAGNNGCTLINDSYNSDLNGLKIALDFLLQQGELKEKKTVILSDILQSGVAEQELYQEVAALIQEKNINRLITIGRQSQSIQKFLSTRIHFLHFKSTADFLGQFNPSHFEQELILLKGARKFQFERIADLLSQKVHQTTLEINLNALIHNLNVFHHALKPGTKIMVMVKAAAYGSGSIEVARLLEFNKVDYLAVAYADEGVELRRKGIQLPILVLNPEKAVFDNIIRYQLEPEIYSFALLKQFAQKVADQPFPYPIHIKLDTGMHRLGFEAEDLELLAHSLAKVPQLRVQSIFSHLAASEASEHDAFTSLQYQRFETFYNYLSEQLGYRPTRHLLNSSGIIRFPEYQMDMVRLGIGLYGIDPLIEDQLQEVLQLKARISQIKVISPEETIGYGRMGTLAEETPIGTVSIGYADGLSRAAGNRRHHLFVRGEKAPIIGNVCMDMCMIDLSAVKNAREGEEVVLFESTQQLRELAQALHTIPYEIISQIAPRVKRIYTQE